MTLTDELRGRSPTRRPPDPISRSQLSTHRLSRSLMVGANRIAGKVQGDQKVRSRRQSFPFPAQFHPPSHAPIVKRHRPAQSFVLPLLDRSSRSAPFVPWRTPCGVHLVQFTIRDWSLERKSGGWDGNNGNVGAFMGLGTGGRAMGEGDGRS